MIRNILGSLEEKKVLSKNSNFHFHSFNIFLSVGYTKTTNARAERKKINVNRPFK